MFDTVDFYTQVGNLTLGQEVSNPIVNFQYDAKIGKALEDMHAKGMKIKDKYFDPLRNNIEEVNTKIAEIWRKELPEIFDKYLGMNIKKLNIGTQEKPLCNASIGYCHFMDFDADILLDYQGNGQQIPIMDKNNYIKRMLKIRELTKRYDSTTGKLNGKFKWPIELNIDVSTWYFFDLYMPIIDGKKPEGLGAREFTAVILHEAGHCAGFLARTAVDFYVYKETLITTKKFLADKPSIYSMKEFIEKILIPTYEDFEVKIKDIPDPSFVDTSKIQLVKNMISKLNSFCDLLITAKERTLAKSSDYVDPETAKMAETINNNGEADRYEGYDSYGTYVQYVIALCLGVLSYCLFYVVNGAFSSLFNILDDFMDNCMNTSDARKLGDLMGTAHNTYNNERTADSFAVRLGYADGQASFMQKATLLYGRIGGMTQNIYIRSSSIISFFNSIFSGLDKFLTRNQLTHYTYEKTPMRIRRLLQELTLGLKDKEMPAVFRDSILANMKKTEAVLKEMDQDIYVSSVNPILKVLNFIISPVEWYRILTIGGVSADYEKQFNVLEDMMGNQLFRAGASIKSIIDGLKKKK